MPPATADGHSGLVVKISLAPLGRAGLEPPPFLNWRNELQNGLLCPWSRTAGPADISLATNGVHACASAIMS